MGSDQYFVNSLDVRIRSYLTTAPSVLGYLLMAAMDALCQVDALFKRVYSRNMFLQIIHWMRPHVSLLADMDDWSLTLLACKVNLSGYRTGETIVLTGDPSDYAYIILGGSVKEIVPSSVRSTGSVSFKRHTEQRQLKCGALFNVDALTSNQPCFYTAVATEPTLLLCLSKRVLDQIYYNDKAKLCEMRIRLMGAEVDLLHAIDHPTGSALFLKFLAKQLAAENLTFYKAVDSYNSLCGSVIKQIAQIQKLFGCLQDFAAAALVENTTTTTSGTETEAGDGLCATSPGESAFHAGHMRHVIARDSCCTVSTDTESGMDSLSAMSTTHVVRHKPKPVHNNSLTRRTSFSLRVAVGLSDGEDKSQRKEEELSTGTFAEETRQTDLTGDASAGICLSGTSWDSILGVTVSSKHAALSSTSLRQAQQYIELQSGCAAGSTTTDSTMSDRSSPGTTSSNYSSTGEMVTDSEDQAHMHTRERLHRQKLLQDKQARCGQCITGTNSDKLLHTLHHAVSAQDIGYDDECSMVVSEGETQCHSYCNDRLLRLTEKIQQKLHSLLKQMIDLQRVTRMIMETYIHDGAEHQVNLPYTLRIQCETAFQSWCAVTATHLSIKSINTHTPPYTSEAIHMLMDLSFVDLFKEAKSEVLKLLRDGMFPRWKNTADFHSFIEGIKPYNTVEEEDFSIC